MSKTAAINMRIEPTIKAQAEHHRTGSHADLFQPILWDRLFLLLFYADVPAYGTFSSLKSEEPAPAPLCNKRAETGSFH